MKKKNLSEINLSKCSNINDRTITVMSKLLKNSPKVKKVILSKNNLTNKGIKKLLILLLSCKNLNFLDLSNNLVTEEILIDLEEACESGLNIKIVNFQGCGVLPVTSRNIYFLKKIEQMGVKLML